MLGFLRKVPVVGGMLNNLVNGPDKADQTPLTEAQNRAKAFADSLAAERAGVQDRTGPTAQAATINQAQANQLRAQQTGALGLMQSAATGAAPSAAEIAGRTLADRGASQAFGAAAALQGGMSSGGALRRALQAHQGIISQNAADTMAGRANEMAHARDAYAASLQGARGQDIGLATGQAGLDQQTNVENLHSQLDTNRLTEQQREALLNAQTRGEGLVQDSFGNRYKANAADAAASNADTASKFDMVIGGAKAIFSDRREKTDVHPADLDALAASLRGVGFEYRHPDIPGEAPGHRVGVLAQDAERGGPLGRGMVVKERGEPLQLDAGNALGASLAMAAEALRRTRARRAA